MPPTSFQATLIALVCIFIIGGVTVGISGEDSTAVPEQGGGELSQLGVDTTIPDNERLAFYSAAFEGVDLNETEFSEGDIEQIEEEMDIDNLLGGDHSVSGAGQIQDYQFTSTESLVAIDGFGLSEYRERQVENIDTTSRESYVFTPWYDDTKSDGVIDEAYVAMIGTENQVQPQLELDGQSNNWIGKEGSALTYLDYYVDATEIPSGERSDIETIDNGTTQIQENVFYDDQNHDVNRSLHLIRDLGDSDEDTITVDDGIQSDGGEAIPYTINNATDVKFNLEGGVSVDIIEIQEERTRDLIEDSKDYNLTTRTHEEVSVEEEITVEYEHSENESSGDTIELDVSETVDAVVENETTYELQDTIYELDGEREIDINEQYSIMTNGTVEGVIDGTIEGELGDGNTTTLSGTIDGTISGDIEGERVVTVAYEYWDWWDSEQERDGLGAGWERISEEVYRTDEVAFEDSMEAYVSSNNDITVNQTVIQLGPEQYHVMGTIDYPGDEPGENMSAETFEQQIPWSMITLGDQAVLDNDWHVYSQMDFGQAYSYQDLGGDEGRIDFANQLSVHMFSSNAGPQILGGGGPLVETELSGWRGDYVDTDHIGIDENVSLERGEPIRYNEFVLQHVPGPMETIVDIHGNTHEIDDESTTEIRYAEPSVSIDNVGADDERLITVYDVDGNPMEGKTVQVTGSMEDYGEFTTDEDGEVVVEVDNARTLQVYVEGDDIEDFIGEDVPDEFYGSVIVQQSTPSDNIIAYMTNAVQQLAMFFPIVLLYAIWKHKKLGS